jgi:hypothetical protein
MSGSDPMMTAFDKNEDTVGRTAAAVRDTL